MYAHAAAELTQDGFLPRSTSGYYNPERHPTYCRFLDYYWRTWPMIGFGVSSKSVVENHVWTNVKPLKEYMRRVEANESVLDFGVVMTKPQEMRRVMIRGLKMCTVDKADFLARFGVEMEMVFAKQIEQLMAVGLLENLEDQIRLTPKGRVYGPNVYSAFYTEDDVRPVTKGEVQFGISHQLAD
jgi:oxygen-independent coproporphyrinogen-3 oxidase